MIDISKVIGNEWHKLSDNDKRPYHDTAGIAYEAYRMAKEAYEKSKPKRPRTAYAFFMKVNRNEIASQHPGVSPKDLMQYIAAAWKSLDVETRGKYNTMASEDRERWNRDSASSQ
jgi:hypothetical protein